MESGASLNLEASQSNLLPGAGLELTILMPCLDEAETIGVCVNKAMDFLKRTGIQGEVLIGDNGSTDGSQQIARSLGAQIVHVPVRGYGAALLGGIAAARGRYVIMGDSDDSYDFSKLDAFVAELRKGKDLVMGNRFRGGIEPGAMPFLHRYLGNPILSFIGRLFFGIECRDFHCGIRGFNTERIRSLALHTTGMEFASEMIVRAALHGYQITEVPTTLKKDGRSRPPHLRTWRDGWRHLRFLLLFSPRWLFLYPGLALLIFGLLLSVSLLSGPKSVLPNLEVDVHSLVVGSFMILIGMQCISFGLIARRYASARGFLPPNERVERLTALLTLERTLALVTGLFLFGVVGLTWSVVKWASVGFGHLEFGSLIRIVTVSSTAVALALQIGFTAFLAEIVGYQIGADVPQPSREC